jgi:hypothetical protein
MAEVELRRRLERATGRPIALVVTDNRTSMLYVSPGSRGLVRVRVHHMFLDAPSEIVRALALYVLRPSAASRSEINAYVRANSHRIGGRPRRKIAINLSHRGLHFDLNQIYERLNRRYFDGRLKVAITWGKSAPWRRYSIDFGCYDAPKRVIRVNPALDRPFVPRFFINFIVYHEMLHAAIGFRELPNGRRDLHSLRFRREESQFRFYRSALRWENGNLWRFLRAT